MKKIDFLAIAQTSNVSEVSGQLDRLAGHGFALPSVFIGRASTLIET
jgi:hypothetical protein